MSCRRDVDLAGLRFGKLTVVSRHSRTRIKGNRRWLCRCDCGGEAIVTATRLQKSETLQCKACGRKDASKKMIVASYGLDRLLREYRKAAIYRNIEWYLSDENAAALFQGDCFWCGDAPNQISKSKVKNAVIYVYNGIDRLDNAAGYTVSNCVPCCTGCNTAKMRLTVAQFLEKISKIYLKHCRNNGVPA